MDSHLPDWLEEGIDPSLRDSENDTPQAPVYAQVASQSSHTMVPSSRASSVVLTPTGAPSPSGSFGQNGSKAPWSDLDKFYEDTNDGEEETESEGSDDQSSDDEQASTEGEDRDDNSEGDEESEDDQLQRSSK